MLILLGETRSTRNIDILQSHGWGRMFVVRRPSPFAFERWGFDNGAFVAFCRGLPFPEAEFMKRLEAAEKVNSDPYMAVAPDIVAGGCTSLQFSASWVMSHKLPDWRWYLAVQDGMTVVDVEPYLHIFQGVFLGGTDKFKLQAYRWSQLAHKHRLPFHYARAGTIKKMEHAFRVGADSLDSSFPLWNMDRMKRFVWAVEGQGSQRELPFAG